MNTSAAVRPSSPADQDYQKILARGRRGRRDVKLSPYLYISPFFLIFAVIGLFPLLYTAYIATRQWNMTGGDQGVALVSGGGGERSIWGNFMWALGNPEFWLALRNTFSIFILSSGPQIMVAMVLAAILSANLRAKTFWRMGVLLPYVVAPMAAGIIFRQMFSDETGIINQMLGHIGLDPISWHGDVLASHLAVAAIVNFRWTGYNTLVLLAAMQAIPRETYEAAVVDGAGPIRQFWSITVPMIRPTLVFVIITSTIAGLQVFDEPQMFSISNAYGGSGGQFLTVTQLLWKTGFVSNNPSNMGRAAAIAWILFLIIVVFAILNFMLTRRIASPGGTSTKSKKTKVGGRK
ncbi:MAG: sugar ABC transporter permease [Bifidobacteriaceae bacterium]|jgi:cellobiose transport system permease protein|nr:sugar ABC transporter permease [Bifidobacteriaceae bacterium]